jgi:ATP-dependent DNA ligase
MAQIEFTEWTPDGHLMHASFAGLRTDKEPRSIVREESAITPTNNKSWPVSVLRESSREKSAT